MKLYHGDLTDASSLRKWVDAICPNEIYSLATQSCVDVKQDPLKCMVLHPQTGPHDAFQNIDKLLFEGINQNDSCNNKKMAVLMRSLQFQGNKTLYLQTQKKTKP